MPRLRLALLHAQPLPPAPHRYAQSCGDACDLGLWRHGVELATSAATGELASDEVAHLTPAGACRVCGAATTRWRLVCPTSGRRFSTLTDRSPS